MGHMRKTVSNEDCRLRLTELATEVRQAGVPIDVYAVAGQPRYQLSPENALEPDRIRSSVRIGPDKFRRYFSEIRGLALFDDIPFALVIRGELVAVFQRHPTYRPVIAGEFRAEFAKRQAHSSSDLPDRISAIEQHVETLRAKLEDQSEQIRQLYRRTRTLHSRIEKKT